MPWEHGTAVTGAAFHPMRPYQPLMLELHKFRVGGTGISGLEFSENGETGFLAEWQNVALLANPITSTINAVRIHRNPNGTVEAEHLPDLLTAKDTWFRPVKLEFGPYGCLYVADFYNKIIFHNEVTTDHPDRDRSHGRIWRIRHETQAKRVIPNVAKANATQLLTHLQAPHLWEKRAAWQQIADRGLKELAPTLAGLAGSAKVDVITRIHALWSLEELGHLDVALMGSLLVSTNDSLRREAVRSFASFDLARMALEKFPAELKAYLSQSSGDHPAANLLWAIQALDDASKQGAFLGIWDKVSGREMDAETFVAIAGMLGNADVYKAVQPTFHDPSKADKFVRLALVHQSRVQSPGLAKMLTPAVSQLLKSNEALPLALSAVATFKMDALNQQVSAILPGNPTPETLRF